MALKVIGLEIKI